MLKNMNKQSPTENALYEATSQITAIIEKYTDQIDLMDIIDIVDNLRVLVDIAEKAQSIKSVNVA